MASGISLPRPLLVFCLLLVLSIPLFAQTAIPPAQPVVDFTAAPSYKVVRVVDGDTVVLRIGGKDVTVRLIGVDTPETVHPSKPVEAYGKEASRFTENLLKGESVYVRYEPGPSNLDKYGRTLAYLYRAPDGLFANLEIVRQGYGHAYVQYPFSQMEMFRYYERKARESGKGLWATAAAQSSPGQAITPAPAVSAPADDNVIVYITKTGLKYHHDGCRYLARSKILVTLKEAKSRGYTPCKVCKPPE